MKRAILLLSGGLDSAANLVLGTEFRVELAATVDYGQRAAGQEDIYAKALANSFDIEHLSVPFRIFPELLQKGGALLEETSLPRYGVSGVHGLENEESVFKSAQTVWVPNRNGVLISLAASIAESRGLDAVVLGFNAEEARTFPDNTVQFMKAMTRALTYSTRNQVEVLSATALLSKHEIVRKLEAKGFPFERLWTCYDGGKTQCGVCESCTRLIRALSLGLVEPKRSRTLETLFGAVASPASSTSPTSPTSPNPHVTSGSITPA